MRIPQIDSLKYLADMLGMPKFVVTKYIFQADRHYKQFRIPKRSGHSYRIICAPSKQLKGIQRWIMAFILRKVDVSAQSTAFRPGCSILCNARPHIDTDFVFNADIKDFFPSITTERVCGLFKSFGYPGEVAFALARLTTFNGRLPQGAPSSPDIANIICRKLDSRLQGLCNKRGWSYTRYCDDMTISGAGGISNTTISTISEIVQDEGFVLNPRKTHTVRQNGRQMVTGLVVNEDVSIPRYQRKRWRAVFHQAKLEPKRFVERTAELQGYISFLRMVNPGDSACHRYEEVLQRVRCRRSKLVARHRAHHDTSHQ